MKNSNNKMVPQKAYLEIISEIQAVLGDKNDIVMAKVGLNLGKRFAQDMKDQGKTPRSIEDLFRWMTDYLQNELLYAHKVELTKNDGKFIVNYGEFDSDTSQCLLCVGDMVKEKGGSSACPISSFIMGAYRIYKNDLKIKRIQLEEISKPESKKPGSCAQKFIIELRE